MVDFRRWITALAVLTLFAGLAAAQGAGSQAPLTCSTNVTATPQLRAEGYTENTGDITITCTGGPNTAVGATIPSVNITVFFNTQVTSRLLGGGPQSEALLLIDEPGSLSLPAAVGPIQPFGPQAGQNVCGNPTFGCTEVVSSTVCTTNTNTPGFCAPGIAAGSVINVATNNPQGTTATSNGYNVFQGIVSTNSVTWFGVPVLAPGTSGITRTFRFTNIRVNASALSGGSASGAQPVLASIAVSNTAALPITNPTPTVGFVQSGLSSSVGGGAPTPLQQCTSTTLAPVATVTFSENFGTAFKTRVVPTGTGANSGQGTGGPQNVPGTVYNSESNFILAMPAGNGGGTAGLADWGTRLKATFNNVPTNVRLFVSINNVVNAGINVSPVPSPIGGTDTVDSYAEAVLGETAAENAGAGAFPVAGTFSSTAPGGSGPINVTELAVSGGSATAIWEVVNTNPSKTESFTFAVYATTVANVSQNSPPAGTATVNLSFAPTPPGAFTAGQGPVASSGNIPRFIQDPGAAKPIFTINVCRTILLYPFVTNQAGFDTGLAIANTSTDPFGTGPQAGACQMNWYSGTTSPAPTSSGNIPSGTDYVTLASMQVPGFQGYMIAICQFQYAHGYAAITDVGARNLISSYLALVMPDPASNSGRAASGLDKAKSGSGEITSH